ncbi:hypothetical protein CRE_03817 [Caenorhabditis remanei]|uniref:non-specific serine/threonine protein kinase n=1 Tax=Caenorhabditis remanei TaxID=31234 RepID=E3LXA0_CAERE|nr:hypothetical protein CRE_03817 [Caenorhabditis remanei]
MLQIQNCRWSQKRKYSVVLILSYVVRRWGLEARDLILREVFELTDNMFSLISVEHNNSQSKVCMMRLVDDLVKLAMIDTSRGHRTISEKTEENIRNLVKAGINESLKSILRQFSQSSSFVVLEEYIRYVANWFLAERRLDSDGGMIDESFESTRSDETKKERNELSLEGLIHLSFGASTPTKYAAWNVAIQILNEILNSRRWDARTAEKILSILWGKRKLYQSENVRISFCSLLSTSISQNLKFGEKSIPSIDSILKYSLSLMPNVISLPNAALLTENILKYCSNLVPKGSIQLIWDTVSRTSPSSFEVVRLLSAMISYTEFDENGRFANDENVGRWSLRKDIIEWLLVDPNVHCHKLIYELCHYHPIFCYESEEPCSDDELLQTMKLCKLVTPSKESSEVTEPPSRIHDAYIQEIVNYADDKLKCLLSAEVTLPVFLLSYEFSRKFPDVFFDFDRIYQRLPHIMNDLNCNEFLHSVNQISEWPQNLELPMQFLPPIDCIMAYFLKNLHNQLLDLGKFEERAKEIIETLAEHSKKYPRICEKVQKSMQINRFVKKFILENNGDPYEMTSRYEKFSFLLSHRHLLGTREIIMSRSTKLLEEEAITGADLFIFEKLTSSTCLRNITGSRKLGGYELDAHTVSKCAEHVAFDERSLKIYLRSLKKSPFLAQNIVRTVLENGEMWHLHGKMLKSVMKNEPLLTVCIATIPNMVRYLKIYQVHFQTKLKAVQFLNLDKDSMTSCQKYLLKSKQYSHLITPNNLTALFGCEKKMWKRLIFRFWKLFEQEPALVCEKLHTFASECVDLGLKHLLVELLKALTSSEFCQKVIMKNHLRTVFELTYRSIFLVLTKDKCSPEILELCEDHNLRSDLFEHRIKCVPPHHVADFERFQMKISLAIEHFFTFGTESDSVDMMNFGLIEFYKQLNDNLTEDAIKSNEKRNIYLVDKLSTIWLALPSMRSHIRPIVARFKHVSPAWTHFPQPPHTPATENTFTWKLRFHITLKMMKTTQWKSGEFATCIMLFLTSFDGSYLKTNLIEERQIARLKNETKRNVLCILSKILRRETAKEAGKEDELVIEESFFEAITRSASLFPDVAAFTVPFLFKLCVDSKQNIDFATSKLLACLRGVQQDDQQVVYCLAECVDSIGLNAIARYERIDLKSNELVWKGQFRPQYYFLLARLFLRHGYRTHAFAIANILFDRLSSKKRNIMMINRITLNGIENSDELIELLVDIYVAENNSTALSSLPPGVQNRPDVRQVIYKSSKEWKRLISSDQLNSRESTIIQWMCGLPSNPSKNDKYLDSILRCHFNDYPKILESPLKLVYFSLFHQAIGTEIPSEISDYFSKMVQSPTIDEMRLMMISNNTANFEPESIEEHVIEAIRNLRETVMWREKSSMEHVHDVNSNTKKMVKLAELLTENNAYDAAMLLLNSWEEECLKWKIPTMIDVDIIRICKEYVTCQSGDARMAEINLRSMQPSIASMTDVALAEWTIALSKITIEYRNNHEEGIRILEFGCRNLEKKNSLNARLKVLLKFHSVCIEQLSKLEEYLETRSYRMKKEVISEFEKQLAAPRVQRGNSRDEGSNRTIQRVRKEQQIEKADVEKVENLVLSAARKAVSSAFQALSCISQLDDDLEAIRTSSLIIFPLIDVVYKYEQDQGVVNLLRDHSKTQLPSKLWLCATSHLASKCFSPEKSPITRYLSQILCHLIYDYPYHVLHTILMYEYEKNGSEVRHFLKQIYSAKTNREMKEVAKLKQIVDLMRETHSAYREIASLNVKENVRIQRMEVNGKTVLMWPSELKIFKCKLHLLPIPTITQKIGRPGDLSTTNLITWKSWKNVFTIADGLSAPKIWEIQGSDGKWYKTVWKKDDVRQDVLVEQMFDVTNNMLEKRMLRTYNVVPLDTECGIIEFCGGTVSLKELLCGTNRLGGLHHEFNPKEPGAIKVSQQMREVQMGSTEVRREIFVDICQQYSPVFRHFFYTNFPTAHIWREKIINYRQSLATWSVVCYIVGLGDRHASNILFDEKECTFVHIDLGMILEYSKRSLPVPEQVPFRISRDVLDPILIEGIENGQLAEDCTLIMEKLKENGKVILGVASALLRETMTNFREADQQIGRPSYISEMAIGRLRDKLRGTDDGVTAQSSNLQIRRLLREATNADNLSRMFCGWMPFL